MDIESLNTSIFFIGGQHLAVNGIEAPVSGLPVQNIANVVGLSLTDRQLEGVAKSNQPTLATERAHFADMVYVYDRIAVDPLELLLRKALFDTAKRLGRQESLF